MYEEDIVVKHIHIKNKLRKIVSYRSEDCELRKYHSQVALFLNAVFIPSVFTKAYKKHESIYNNAKAHMYNDVFIMLDVENFFPSINHKTLISKLYYELNKFDVNTITLEECHNLIEKCSFQRKGLPLGFITSPILSNIYMKEFDGILYGTLKKKELRNIIYTRYADDLCISFKSDELNTDSITEIINLVSNLLKRYHLSLNKKKTRYYSLNDSNHVKITGVNVVKESDDYRRLTVGQKVKNDLFWKAIKCKKDSQYLAANINKIKGMQSFILSIEKQGYENSYSPVMIGMVHEFGYSSLKELIDDFGNAETQNSTS